MLGSFLEYSVQCADIAQSLDFYHRLGFTQALAGDAWEHPYAVVTDGRLCIGLHGTAPADCALTFVRPGILELATRLETQGLAIHHRHLGNGVFNQIGLLSPDGTLLRMIEARSFSPSMRRSSDTSVCGYFLEVALPAPEPDKAVAFWEGLGFVGMDEPEALLPRISCISDSINVGLHDPRQMRESALVFEGDDLDARIATLRAAGIEPESRLPPVLRGRPVAQIRAPEGTLLVLLGATD